MGQSLTPVAPKRYGRSSGKGGSPPSDSVTKIWEVEFNARFAYGVSRTESNVPCVVHFEYQGMGATVSCRTSQSQKKEKL